MTDYVQEDHEEVVLTRWERLKKWFEIAMATKKLYMFVMALLVGTTGTLAVGEITETNPLRDAAIEVGLISEEQLVEEMVDKLIEEEKQTRMPVAEHSHPHTHDFSKELSNIIPEDHMELH